MRYRLDELDKFLADAGYRDLDEMIELVEAVDTSTAPRFAAFLCWLKGDGSKAGLIALLQDAGGDDGQ